LLTANKYNATITAASQMLAIAAIKKSGKMPGYVDYGLN